TPTKTDVINFGRFCERTAFCTTLIINPAKPIKLKATKYSINACNGVKIHASPVTICKIHQINPEMKLAFTPQRNATIKIGIIDNEIEMDGIGLIPGNKSINIANAAKIATSSIACNGKYFFI